MLRTTSEQLQALNQRSTNLVPISKKKWNYSIVFRASAILFFTFLLFGITTEITQTYAEQTEMSLLLNEYHNSATEIIEKTSLINSTIEDISEEDFESIKVLEEKIVELQGMNDKETQKQQPRVDIEMIENQAEERQLVLEHLLSHAKQEIISKKMNRLNKVAQKDDFKEERVRNAWALGRLNLKSSFVSEIEKRKSLEQIQKEERRLEYSYRLSYFKEQLPLCVVVATYNNAEDFRYQSNLQSILNQDYDNYHIVIVDDASDDGTADLIDYFLRRSNLPFDKYVLIRNKKRLTAVPNINSAIKKYCKTDEIAVLVNGDDQLLGKKVFSLLNAIYQAKKPAVAYSNHFFGKLHQDDFEKGYSNSYSVSEIKNKNYRFIGQKFGHLRTFAVSLFLLIKQEHMKLKNGEWIGAAYDETFFMPMLQMACDSIEFINEYLYLYNYGTGNNDGEVIHQAQIDAAGYVRQLPKYECLPQYQKYVI